MPYRGPSRGGDSSIYERIMGNIRVRPDDEFVPEQPSGNRSGGVTGIDTDYMQLQDRQEAEKARLAMTPGVIRGGSTATRPQADSPLNVGATQRFTRFGDTYSYDPMVAAETEGRAQASAQNAADKERYSALLNTPGINPRQASRLVYGRGDILDADPIELRNRLAAYLRQPSRGAAADAVAAGANPGAFDRLPASGDEMADMPVRGTPKYFDTMRQEEGIRTDANIREIKLRDQLTDDNRMSAATRQRWKVKERGTGRVGVLDPNSGEVEWTEAFEDTPGAKGPNAIMQRFGLPGVTSADLKADAQMRVVPRRGVPAGTGMATIEEEARQALATKGIDDPTADEFDDMKALIALKRTRERRRGAP